MKEYLLERDGKYELHKGGIVPDGAIEVPEGAEIAVKTEAAGNIFFWKDLEFHRVPGDHWINLGEGVEWYKNSVPCTVIWQRTPSLNDQYAEIEQVRQGLKADKNKPRMSLLPKGVLSRIINVLEFGALKYEVDNWKHVDNARTRYYDAMNRHIESWWNGEKHDSETKEHHLAHAICCAMFLVYLDSQG